jgi:modulator of FtsH protease
VLRNRSMSFTAVPLSVSGDPARVLYIQKVFGLLLVGLAVAVGGGIVGMQPSILPITAGHPILSMIAMFGLVIWASKAAEGPNAQTVYYIFTFGMGLIIAPVIAVVLYKHGGAGIVVQAAVLTAINFSALAAYTFISKRDFSFMGGFLMTGLITVIIAQLLNAFFFHSSAMVNMMSWVIVALFNGFILYDLSRILHSARTIPPTMAAMSLFLDVFNLFLAILRILDRD